MSKDTSDYKLDAKDDKSTDSSIVSMDKSSYSHEDPSPTPSTYINRAEAKDDETFMRINKEKVNKNSFVQPYSTTSSVFAEHTISNPNNDQMLYCIAAIIQAQIFDDSMNPDLSTEGFEVFDLDIRLPPQYGGPVYEIPEAVLNHETLNDLELRDKLIEGSVPTVDTINKFISMLNQYAQYSIECNILALIYITRVTGRNQMAMTMRNWRGLFVGSMIIAQKVYDDQPLKTSSFVKLLPNISKETLRNVEMKLFCLLDYSASVKLSCYAKYYFELRDLYKQIITRSQKYFESLHLEQLALQEEAEELQRQQQREAEERSSAAGKQSHSHGKPQSKDDSDAKDHSGYRWSGKKLTKEQGKFLEERTYERSLQMKDNINQHPHLLQQYHQKMLNQSTTNPSLTNTPSSSAMNSPLPVKTSVHRTMEDLEPMKPTKRYVIS